MPLRCIVASILAGVMGACAAPTLPTEPASNDATVRLHSLLATSDEAYLDRNPIDALYRGDTRRAAQHGDYLSPAYVRAEHSAAQSDLSQLARIARDSLSPGDRAAYDTFRWTREDARERHSPAAASIWPLLKLDQMNGWHLFFPDLSSGDGVAPYRNVAEYDDGLSRITGFIAYLDRSVERMREGQRSGVVLPRVVVERVITQFERFAGQGLGD